MPEGPAYVILGRGRWAGRLHNIITGENRRATEIAEARQTPGETDAAYRSRLAETMRASGAQIAWLCVLPGPHVATMVDAALDAGLHIVVEKPWLCPGHAAQTLMARARQLGRVIAIHYEYCLLHEVEQWRAKFHPGAGLGFGGRFLLSRPNHTGMTALDNLGSHLLSILLYATPQAAVRELRCGYEQPDERSVWLEKGDTRVASINLLESKQPIIQDFIARFEAALGEAHFPLDLEFAQQVAEQVQALR